LPDEEKAKNDKQDAETNPKPVEQPPTSPSSAADHISEQRTDHTNTEKHPTEYDFRKWSLVFTFCLDVIGSVYSFFSYQQWQSMRDQINIAKEQIRSTRAGERAWVGQSEISGKAQEGQAFQITVIIKNTGKSFAKRYSGVTAMRTKELSEPDPDFETILREGSDASTSGLIPPDGSAKMVLEVGNGIKMTKEHIDQLSNPTNVMLVFGKLTYRDIFACDHWTVFCYRVRVDGTFELYGKYNDADENECL